MTDSIGVIGRNIFSSEPYKQKPPSRRIFQTDWLQPVEYQHEIANHYRDYKNRQKSRRQSRKGYFPTKRVFFEDQTVCDYRDVLPINRIDFPQSVPGFLQQQPFSAVYDHTLRRILTANTLLELEYLAQRQNRLHNFKTALKTTQGLSIKAVNGRPTDSKTSLKYTRAKRCKLGQIRSDKYERTQFPHQVACNQQSIFTPVNKVNSKGLSLADHLEDQIDPDATADKEKYFLRLASECYDEGFLAHIKYLESIGERNAKYNQISQRGTPRHISANTSSRTQSAGSYVSSSDSVEDLPNNTVGVKGFVSVANRILQNCRFARDPCNYDKIASGAIQHDWNIRVNITRSSSPESLHSSRSSIQEHQDIVAANHCIMSDIANGNKAQPQQISTTNGSSVKRQHFHDLIENLNNLEISELGSLPKIVLTDFSTTNIVPESAAPLRTKSHETSIVKQQSLEVDLPSLSDYSSEARPP